MSLLKVDEYRYNKEPKVVTGDMQPIASRSCREKIIELTLKSPYKPESR